MKINRHNYEELFLLYVDNELPADQRAEVDLFVAQNPDLHEEFVMLQHAVLPAEMYTSFDKNALYRSAPGITLENYESYFLLYVDDELNRDERNEVERFVLQHPSLQQGFTLLRKTRLEPEIIEFKGKDVLLRNGKPETRILTFTWQRLASAAAIAGLVFMIWLNPKGSKTVDPVVNTLVQNQVPAKTTTKEVGLYVAKENNTKPGTAHQRSATQDAVPSARVNTLTRIRVKEKQYKEKLPASNDRSFNENGVSLARIDEGLPESNIKNSIVKNGSEGARELIEPVEQTTKPVTASTNLQNTQIQHALYREANPENDEDDRTLLIGGAEINKNKLRGLFKKAANLFDRKVKSDDKEYTVQVANFEIKTK